jgi:cation diffusion facilitator family transporter
VANLVVGVAKLIAGLLSHSTAMLAEAAHSFADTSNEILLALSLRRARLPPDPDHPIGHGRERFLWALMAAIASFLIGGCFSVAIAIHSMLTPPENGHVLAAWIVLAISFVAELISWIQSVRQAREEARERKRDVWTHLQRSSDPIVRAIVVEDSAAIIGLILAAAGLLIRQLTGSSIADSIASLLIGLLLGVTAVGLARPLAEFLVGRSLPRQLVAELRAVVEKSEAVEEVELLQAVYTGPEEAIVVARIHPRPMPSEALAKALDDIDRALREASPFVSEVFLDARPHGG